MAIDIFAVMKTDSNNSPHPYVAKRTITVPIYIRRLMAFLEFLHWRLALYVALKLFLTPTKFPIPKRELGMREESKTVMIPLDGRQALLFEWGTGDKKILLMHGWAGRASQFFRLIERLVSEGFHVYAVEGPAHGTSTYKRTNMLEFAQAIEWAYTNHGPFYAGIGHSLGSMALFNAHSRLDGAFEYLVTIGSSANIQFLVDDFCKVINISNRVGIEIVRSIESEFSVTIQEASTDTLTAIWNPKGLIFHDTTDVDVDITNAHLLSKSWTNAELVISKGLGHRRILSDPKVHQRIVDLLQQ